MWRTQSTHQLGESAYLDTVVDRLSVDSQLVGRANALLDASAAQEPLIAQSLTTPQDVRYHAEGPVMRDHLRSILIFLYALVEEKVHLIDIEEFRRLKGYEGEVQELEDMIKEHAALFEVFALTHDIAKFTTATFSSKPGSRGESLGFVSQHSHHFDETAHERAQLIAKYQELYTKFATEQFQGSDRDTQAQFYLYYGINVHYPSHARKIHTPVHEALLKRLCVAHGLTDRDCAMLEDMIVHHLECTFDFKQVRPARMRRYYHIARMRGYDADDFVDLVQGGMLLDQVVGSIRLGPHGPWRDPRGLINFFKSEHNWAPHRRAQKEVQRAQEQKKRRNRIFREVGLDGVALMDLLSMEAGPEFGKTLRRIHAAILGQGDMPSFGKKVDALLEHRVASYYKLMFEHGE